MRKAFIFFGHLIALSLMLIGILSAYIYFFPLGLLLDGIIWYLVKKYEKSTSAK